MESINILIDKIILCNDYYKIINKIAIAPNCKIDLDNKTIIHNNDSKSTKELFSGTTATSFNSVREYVEKLKDDESWTNNKNNSGLRVLYSFVSSNIYHFMYDTLPDLLFFSMIIKKDPRYKIYLLNGNYFSVRNYLTMFNLNEYFSFDRDMFITKDKLHMAELDQLVYFPYHYRDYESVHKKTIYYSYVVERINKLVTNYGISHDKIYISRRSREGNKTMCNHKRLLTNETSVVDLLTKNGFVEIFLEDYDLLTKISIIRNAKKIVLQSSASVIFFTFLSDDEKNNKDVIFLEGPFVQKHVIANIFGKCKFNMITSSEGKKYEHANVLWSLTDKDLHLLDEMTK